jgi:RNase P protein component
LDVVLHPRKSVISLEFAQLEKEIQRIMEALQKGRPK